MVSELERILRHGRKNKKLSQDEVAEMAGLNRSEIVKLESGLFVFLEILKKIIGIIPILVGIFIGIVPMLLVGLVTGIISFFLNSYYTGKLLGYSSWMQIKDVLPSYCLSFIMAVCIWPFKLLLDNYWVVLPLQLIIGVCLFAGMCRIMKLEEYKEIKEIFHNNIQKLRKAK